MSPSLPCIALAGPTASGKTAAALRTAEALARQGVPVEILSVDSALVYRGMDIGTAKPSPAEQAVCPHHLIDIRDPAQAYSAAEFAAEASALIQAIQARGALPLLVGGTMLYLKALIEGLDALPAADAGIRAELDRQAAEQGWPALHAELARIDPVTAARLAPADAQRIQRALEVWRLSGRPLSSFHAASSRPVSPLASMPVISLEPQDRAWLHDRIAQRVDLMIRQGLEAEVATLMCRADLHPDLPSMRCVGYRQTWSMLRGEVERPLWRDQVVAATRQLAKRQLTWLRSWPNRAVIACDAGSSGALGEAVLQRITAHLSA